MKTAPWSEFSERMPLPLGLFVLSGLISGYLLTDGMGQTAPSWLAGPWELQYGPGIWFGLASTALLFGRYRLSLVGPVLWLASSIGAWYAAIQLYMMMNFESTPVSMMVAGLVGGGILAIMRLVVARGFTPERAVLTAVAGCVLGGVMWAILTGASNLFPDEQPRLFYALAFAVWQLGVGLAIVLRALRLPLPRQS